MSPDQDTAARDLLRLTMIPGLGPVLIDRLLARFDSPGAALAASLGALEQVPDIGAKRARAIVQHAPDTARRADQELARAAGMGVRLLPRTHPDYPPLLRAIPDPPPILYIRGSLLPHDHDRFPAAIVGSRECSAYGVEQAERFAGALARAGICIVSGGARGIDAAAHRGALRSQGRTVAVLGCGLAHTYPPEHDRLFDEIAASGAVVSELPLDTAPAAENFPRRNRIISGLSLGTLLIEAGERSGALITARLAGEDHGREVMALPGRVDSPSSRGSHRLLKEGGAALVTEPADVLNALEAAARHHHAGTFEHRYTPPAHAQAALPFQPEQPVIATPAQRLILDALAQPATLDRLVEVTGLDPGSLRAELTMLEINRRIRRAGQAFERA